MDTARLEHLRQYFRDDPKDPFNIYALAIEYLKHDVAQAREYFNILLKEHEGYVPTYYHAAKLCEETGDINEAIRILEKGMAVARKQGEEKAFREMRSAYEELTF